MEFRRHLQEIKEERAGQAESFFPEPAKRAINELLFEIMPPHTTLADVEDLALAIFATVQGAWEDRPSEGVRPCSAG